MQLTRPSCDCKLPRSATTFQPLLIAPIILFQDPTSNRVVRQKVRSSEKVNPAFAIFKQSNKSIGSKFWNQGATHYSSWRIICRSICRAPSSLQRGMRREKRIKGNTKDYINVRFSGNAADRFLSPAFN